MAAPEARRDTQEFIDDLRRAVESSRVDVAEVVEPADCDVILRRLRFHYLDWGRPDGPPIVFLHGGGLTAHTWDIVCLALRNEFRCLALDARGHGDTEWSRELDYSTDAHADDVEAFVRHLGLDRPVLVGMSMGGSSAVRYAQEHDLRALIVIESGPVINQESGQRIADFMRAPAELDSIEDFVARAVEFNPRRDPKRLRRSLLHNLVQLPDGKWTWKYDRRHFGRFDNAHHAARREQIWSNLAMIHCPTLVVSGGDSDVLPAGSAEALAGLMTDGRWVEIAGAGHSVQGDNPRDLVIAIRAFLAEVIPN